MLSPSEPNPEMKIVIILEFLFRFKGVKLILFDSASFWILSVSNSLILLIIFDIVIFEEPTLFNFEK